MTDIQALREQRNQKVTEMRSISDKAEQENRDLSDKETNDFKLLKQDFEKIEGQIDRAEVLADAERRMESVKPRAGHDGTFEQRAQNASLLKIVENQVSPGSVDIGLEKELSRDLEIRSGRKARGMFLPHEALLEKRAILTSGSGGNLIPTAHRSDLYINPLQESLLLNKLGVTNLPGLSGEQHIPVETDGSTAYWLGEHQDVTRSDIQFFKRTMKQKTVAAETEISRSMSQSSNPAIKRIATNSMSYKLAHAIDTAALLGDGTNNQPLGVLNQTGINTVSFAGDPTWEKILEFETSLSNDYSLNGNLGWVTNPTASKKLRSTEKVSGHPDYIMNGGNELAGHPLVKTTIAPNVADASTIFFGNWADLLVGFWSAIDVLANPYHSDVYSKGGILINAFQDVDIAVRHPESFVVATDLATA